MSEREIWKFPLDAWTIARPQEVEMPTGAVVIHAGVQVDTPTVWAEVDPRAPTEQRWFEVFGTGHSMRLDMGVERRHLGSGFSRGGYVWHIYERIAPTAHPTNQRSSGTTDSAQG
jgi:hypothetical protein